MVERAADDHAGNETNMEKWRTTFVSYAEDPSSDVHRWIQMGVARGVVDGNPDGKRCLAEQMGSVFSFVYLEETGGECVMEDLDFDDIQRQTGIPEERLRTVSELMAECGVIKSRTKIVKQLKADSRF